MKTTFPLRFAVLIVVAFAAFIFACKKDSSNNSTITASQTTTLETQADDQTEVSDENENVTNDVNTVLTSQVSTNGNSLKPSVVSGSTSVNSVNHVNGAGSVNVILICDAAVAFDTLSNPRTITITYNGTNCWGNRTRTGTVVVSIAAGVHWRDVNASVTVNIQNLKITRLRDSKSITLNGYKTITNTSGGSLKDLASLGSITHNISDSLSILFADSATRVWQAAKQRVFTYDNGIVITTTGTHSDNEHTGIAEWGTNRAGVAFQTLIVEPLVIRQDCDFRLVSGQVKILRSDDFGTTLILGLDASGNATGCPGSGSYYLQIIWEAPNGRTFPIILPY
jgi:hypothetical protein